MRSEPVEKDLAFKAFGHSGCLMEHAIVPKLLSFRINEQDAIEEAHAVYIIAISGLPTATFADTICVPEVETAIEAQPIDPSTLAMTFSVNDSPLAGQEGDRKSTRLNSSH